MSNDDRTRVLQALRLKGRVLAADLAPAAGLDEQATTAIVEALIAEGNAEDVKGRLRLTPAGREHLAEVLATERAGVDQAALTQLYHAFDEHNSGLKQLMTRWQMKDESTPNDHQDADYDGAIVVDLCALDEQFQPLLAKMVEVAPRLSHYPPRFTNALQKVQGGDHSWFARPLADSYHTVWFELHEDLIGLAGLNRAEEAAAGRAE